MEMLFTMNVFGFEEVVCMTSMWEQSAGSVDVAYQKILHPTEEVIDPNTGSITHSPTELEDSPSRPVKNNFTETYKREDFFGTKNSAVFDRFERINIGA